jgi:hypothetical protein
MDTPTFAQPIAVFGSKSVVRGFSSVGRGGRRCLKALPDMMCGTRSMTGISELGFEKEEFDESLESSISDEFITTLLSFTSQRQRL